MMKKLLLLLLPLLLLVGCQNQIEDESLFHLNEEYYNCTLFTLIDGEELQELEDYNDNFMVFVFMPLCNASALFHDVVAEFINAHEISMYSVPFPEIENTRMANAITHFPTVVIYRDGEVRAFLQTDANEHIPYYQSAEGFASWLAQYIYLENN